MVNDFDLYFLVSRLRTSQSVVDYEELKRLQALSSEPEDRYTTKDQMRNISLKRRTYTFVLEKKHIIYLWSSMYLYWNHHRDERGYLGKTQNRVGWYIIVTFRNKNTGAKTTETLPLPPVENQSSLLNRSVGRAEKDVTPFQRDIKTLRQLIRKL